MEAETETQEAPKPKARSELEPVEPVGELQLVVLPPDDADGCVCTVEGECS